MRGGIFFLIGVVCLLCIPAFADKIYLNTGKTVFGKITGGDEETLYVRTLTGVIGIDKNSITGVVRDEEMSSAAPIRRPPRKYTKVKTYKSSSQPTRYKSYSSRRKEIIKEALYRKEVSLGYNTSQGNSDAQQFSATFLFDKNRKYVDQWTFKGNISYSESENKMDTQKWYVMGRYAFTFRNNKAWYWFYRLESNHDKFAGVDYRFTPSTGAGYWVYDSQEIKLLLEAVLGLEYTDYYRQDTDFELVTIPRLFYQYQLSPEATFTQDLYLYPALTDFGTIRIRSESSLSFSINKSLSLRLSWIDEYNSEPPHGADENDFTFMTSLVYSFPG